MLKKKRNSRIKFINLIIREVISDVVSRTNDGRTIKRNHYGNLIINTFDYYHLIFVYLPIYIVEKQKKYEIDINFLRYSVLDITKIMVK